MVDIDLVIATLVLATGTYVIRLAGVAMGRSDGALRLHQWSEPAVIVLVASVAATATIYDGQNFDGWARIAGVAVAAGLAAMRLPMVFVVVAAVGVTSCLRILGIQ